MDIQLPLFVLCVCVDGQWIQSPFSEDFPLSSELPLLDSEGSVHNISVSLFMSALFCFIDLYGSSLAKIILF
jgi:hypothetical protein